jgi:Holliday junction resolvase RusA-like endonuclease
MSREVAFSVAIKPVGKERARVVSDAYGRAHSYTPPATVAAEVAIRKAFRSAYPRFAPHAGPCEIGIVAEFAVPASWPLWKRTLAHAGLWPHTSRPDADNIAKLVCDALNEHLYADDSSVYALAVRKEYAAVPRVVVTATLFDEPVRP